MDSSERRDLVISLLFLFATCFLYTVSVIANPGTTPIHEWESSSPWEPAPLRMNFLFDSDGPRVIHALATQEGYLALHTLLMDAERVRDDSWMENVVPCAPLPGAELSGLDPSAHSQLGHLKPVGKLLHGLIPVMWHSIAPLSRMAMVSRL